MNTVHYYNKKICFFDQNLILVYKIRTVMGFCFDFLSYAICIFVLLV